MGLTPSDTPSSPSNYASVTPHGRGPAAYDIQAPLDDGEITAAFNSANALEGAGVLYPQSTRQADTARLLESPQGFGLGGYSIISGFHGGGGDDGWPNDIAPGAAPTYSMDD